MQLLAFKDPTGTVYLMSESEALPPLADGYEWTMVVRPDRIADADEIPESEPGSEPAPQYHRVAGQRRGFLDVMVPLLTPQNGQSAQERAQELVNAIPEDVRSKLAQLFRAWVPRQPQDLPPFPGARS